MHGTQRVKDCFLTDLRGTARLKIDQNERLFNSKEAEKFFFPIQYTNIQVTDQNIFVQLDFRLLLSSIFPEGVELSIRFYIKKSPKK